MMWDAIRETPRCGSLIGSRKPTREVVRLRFKKLGEERRGAKGSEAWRRGKRLGWQGRKRRRLRLRRL
jgi:hypothetical protein